jgi:hypothetical protein
VGDAKGEFFHSVAAIIGLKTGFHSFCLKTESEMQCASSHWLDFGLPNTSVSKYLAGGHLLLSTPESGNGG